MKRNLRIFWLFSVYAVKAMVAYPFSTVLFTLGKIIRFGIFFFFIYLLVSSTHSLKGYTIDQTIIFFLTFNIIDTATQTLFREVYRFRQLIVTGELDGVLIRPYHPFLRILFGGIDPMDFLILLLYIGLTIFYILKLPDVTNLAFIAAYVLLTINSLVIGMAFHILILAFGIISANIDHGTMIYRDLINLGRFPIEIYQEPIRWIITFIVPVGLMLSFPTQSLLGVLEPRFIAISTTMGVAFFAFSIFMWQKAIRKYQSWGG